jgi:hypothetical protein
MSIRTCKRLAALVFVLTLCIATHPASASEYWESGGLLSISDGRGHLGLSGDPDKSAGCPPPQVSKTGAGSGTVAMPGDESETTWSVLKRWMTGLLQRIGYRY